MKATRNLAWRGVFLAEVIFKLCIEKMVNIRGRDAIPGAHNSIKCISTWVVVPVLMTTYVEPVWKATKMKYPVIVGYPAIIVEEQ